MLQIFLVRILLSPFSLLYGIGVALRNRFYDWGILKEVEFNLPVISIGNLSIGGTGKTPHVEYLIRLLKDYVDVVTLSRGYNRKTKGFQVVQPQNTAAEMGDEPLQYRRKYRDIGVAVAESRTFGILEIVKRAPQTQVILLDDAFQHRSVKPSLNILLTEYYRPFFKDYLLPSGRLREWRTAYLRADVVIVSKCPQGLTTDDAEEMRKKLKLRPEQALFFTEYAYQRPYYMFNPNYQLELNEDLSVMLICAIANTDYLLDHLTEQSEEVRMMEFEDHHYFTKYELGRLLENFTNWETSKKAILTTEKDAMRLEMHRDFLLENKLPIFVLPAQVRFLFGQEEEFQNLVKNHLLNFTV